MAKIVEVLCGEELRRVCRCVEDWGRFEKNTDFLRLDSLYAYRLFSWFGPYARFGLESTIFPGYIYFDSSQTVTDTASGKDWSPRDELRVSDSFFPLTLKGGGGLRFSTPPATWINAWALLGAGGRFTYTGGLFRLADLSDTPNRIEVEPVGDFHSYGIEATVVLQMTLTRWVVIDTEFDGFAPFDDFQSPTIRWDNNLGLRITSYVSINYGYRLEYIPELNENLQHDHRVQVRFSCKFF